MKIWLMHSACWIPKATNTHSQYVIFVAIQQQQSLHERPSILRHASVYISCRVAQCLRHVSHHHTKGIPSTNPESSYTNNHQNTILLNHLTPQLQNHKKVPLFSTKWRTATIPYKRSRPDRRSGAGNELQGPRVPTSDTFRFKPL